MSDEERELVIDEILELLGIRSFGVYGSEARGVSTPKPMEIDSNILIGGMSYGKYLVEGRWRGYDVHFTLLKVPIVPDFWVVYPTVPPQEPFLTIGMVLVFHSAIYDDEWKSIVYSMVQDVSYEERKDIALYLLSVAERFLRNARRPKDITRAIVDLVPYAELWISDPDVIPSIEERDIYSIAGERLGELICRAVERKKQGVFDRELLGECKDYIEDLKLHYMITDDEIRSAERKVRERFIPCSYVLFDPIIIEEPERYPEEIIEMYEPDFILGVGYYDIDLIKFGKKRHVAYVEQYWEGNTRVDIIFIPERFDPGYIPPVVRGKPLFQPISYMILTSTVPVSVRAMRLREMLKSKIDVRDVIRYYYALAEWWYFGNAPEEYDINRKSWVRRYSERHELPIQKLAVPLHRIHEFISKALYMEITKGFPEYEKYPSIPPIDYELIACGNEISLALLGRNTVDALVSVAESLRYYILGY